MSVRIIYFVHGTTTDNEEHKSTGQNPGILSELGKKQSKELRSKIDLDAIDLVFCSDLQRAIDSANLTFKDSKEIIYNRQTMTGLPRKPGQTVRRIKRWY